MSEPTPPLVDAHWLAANIERPDVKVLDASWTAPFMTSGKTPRDFYQDDHIPGAPWFDIDDIADSGSDLPHMLPSPQLFAHKVGALGVSNHDMVVVYDSNRLLASARAWWMFRTMGHARIAVLDGGLAAWRDAFGARLVSLEPIPEKAIYIAAMNTGLVVSLDQMRSLTNTNNSTQILDARPAPRFWGEAAEPREGLRSGHMPGALNLPHSDLLNDQGRFRSAEELTMIFNKAGIDLDRPLVATCGSGVTAAILALGIAIIRDQDVAIYDGSWSEWGATDNCPVATS